MSEIQSKPHSGCGIASFVVGFFAFTWLTLAWAFAYSLIGQPINGMNAATLGMFNALWILSSAPAVVGVGLGMAALFQTDRRRVLAIIGLCLNLPSSVLIIVTAIAWSLQS